MTPLLRMLLPGALGLMPLWAVADADTVPATAPAAVAAAAAITILRAPPGVTITVNISKLRSTNGLLQACLTATAKTFPECERDPHAQRLTVPAADGPALVFRHVAPGAYAIALIHDENSNGRLDTRFGIPVEGYGFSNNAPVRFGPPKFAAARLRVGDSDMTTAIEVRYIL